MKTGSSRAAAVIRTPLGWAGVVVTGKGIVRIALPSKSKQQAEREIRTSATAHAAGSSLLQRAVSTVRSYLSGKGACLDLPLDLQCATAFQRAVWKAAAAVPYGETRSYAWIAKRIRRPKAARAVGQALGANPVPLLIP